MRFQIPIAPLRALARPRPSLIAVLGVALAAGAPTLSAQRSAAASDSRWQPWYGCWAPVPDSVGGPTAALPVSCIVPAAAGGSAVDVVTVPRRGRTTRERLGASGARTPYDRDGCTGWESATWSPDGRRLYVRSALDCAGDVKRTGEGVLAFTPSGEWMDVRGATMGGYTGVRTVRYRAVATPDGLPIDVVSALERRGGAGVETARLAATAPVGTAAVIEMSRQLAAPVVAAWVAESRQRFAVGARELVALADGGVPAQVTDVMIALAHPQRFALDAAGVEATRRVDGRALADGPRTGPEVVMGYDPFLGGPFGWGLGYGGLGYGGLGYNALGFGYGRVPGGAIYGNGFFPGAYWGSGPVVIVRGDAGAAAAEEGRLVNGRGYTRAGGSAGRTSASDGGTPSGRSSGGASSSGGSSGSSNGRSSSGSGRTAKPRP